MASRFARLLGINRSNAPTETRARVTVRNYGTRPLLVIYEPWCDTYELAPDHEYVFEAISPRPGWLEVEHSADTLTVYAWDACVGRVYKPDGQLLDSLDNRVPDFAAMNERRRAGDHDAAL